jgi:hypothetical protein
MTLDEVELVGEVPGVHRVTRWHNVVFIAWLGRPTAAATLELGAISGRILSVLGDQKLSYVHMIPSAVHLPDSETRAALHDITRAYGQHTACVGVIVRGSGFWASALRSIVTSVRVVAPRTVDIRIHGEMAELLGWFPAEHAQRTGVTLDPAGFMRCLAQARAWQQAAVRPAAARA